MSKEPDPELPADETPDEVELQHNRDEEVAALMDEKDHLVAPQVGGKPPKHLAKLLKEQAKNKSKKVDTVYPLVFNGYEPPDKMFSNRTIGVADIPIPRTDPVRFQKGILHLRGRGSMERPIDILFVGACVLQEEYDSGSAEPQMLRGGPGNLFIRNLTRVGFHEVKWYYTTIAKYNTPRLRLSAPDIRWGMPALEDEIKVLKPKIIVCFGKQPFDYFMETRKLKMRDVQGAFFDSKKYGCPIYVMDSLHVVCYKPEYTDRFMTDLRNVLLEVESMRGIPRIQVVQNYVTITKATELAGLMMRLKGKAVSEMAVDCEWHGQTAWGGRLRSFQLCWQAGHAAYVRLMNEKAEYDFDVPLETVSQIIHPVMNDPKMHYVGHNASADMPWLHRHLGVEVYRKFIFDTMYAQHTVNEYADQKLERLAVKFTDLGRYDIDLLLWKQAKKFDEDDNEGYGFVPDKILIPYGCRDVDATFRCRYPLFTQLSKQGMLRYYKEFVLPFVTDGFYEMMDCGLPINVEFLDEMRETFTVNRDLLITDFRLALIEEANEKIQVVLQRLAPDRWQDVYVEIRKLMKEETSDATMAAANLFRSCFKDHRDNEQFMPFFMHLAEASRFNINSPAQIGRWLFDIKGLEPIKTTKQNGITLSWDKVLKMDKKKREELNPQKAADKQVIKIYAERDPMVARLEELKSVANIVKAFLREVNEETGKEEGIHKWIQGDGRIHGNFSLTETARPRAWKPNILNWPKAITKPIEAGFLRINEQNVAEHRKRLEAMSPDATADRAAIEAEIFRITKKPTSLRANVQAKEGWCLVDMDLKMAEIAALAWQSGDRNMIAALTMPDTQFARVDWENPKKVVRIAYNENEGVPESEWDQALLISPDDPRILRREDGSIIHPKRDLHYEMGTMIMKKPREKCDERLVRDGIGKVGNFCLCEASLILTNRGEVPIEQVRLDDLLWDGKEWVSHDGVVCNGEKVVHQYQGLWATDNHEVWTDDGQKVMFGYVRKNRLNLARVYGPSGQFEITAFEILSGNGGKVSFKKRRTVQASSRVCVLREAIMEDAEQSGEWSAISMSLPEQRLLEGRFPSKATADSLLGHEVSLRESGQQGCEVLSGARGKSSVSKFPGVYYVGIGDFSQYGFQRFGIRSEESQWSLFPRQFASGRSFNSDAQSSNNGCGTQEVKVARVYDILNAGPRHRFTCEGVLVSNSIPYGATPTLLERMIEANTGLKPNRHTGEIMIQAWQNRYPEAKKFQEEMELIVKDPGYWRSLSGRVRHFEYAELAELEGFDDYKKKGIFSGLARQARNFPCQEIVAATTGKALLMFIDDRRKMSMRSRIGILLYDAMTAFVPLEEVRPASDLLRDCLTVRNEWNTKGGLMHFEVDTTIGFRWGVKATAEERKLIEEHMR